MRKTKFPLHRAGPCLPLRVQKWLDFKQRKGESMRNKVIAFLATAVICLTTVSPAPVWAAEEPVRTVSSAGEHTEDIRSLSDKDGEEQVNAEEVSREQGAVGKKAASENLEGAAGREASGENPEDKGGAETGTVARPEAEVQQAESFSAGQEPTGVPEEETAEITTEEAELVEMRNSSAGTKLPGIRRIAAGDRTIRVRITDDPGYYRYYGGYLKKHATTDGDSVYCMERVKSSKDGTYTLASNYWGNSRAEAACSYVLGNGQYRLGEKTRNAAYSTGDGNYDYAVTQMAVWGVLDRYGVQVDTGGIAGDRNAGFSIHYQELTTGHGVKDKAAQLFQDAIAYADAHPDAASYVTPEVTLTSPADISMKADGSGEIYTTDAYTLTARYGAAPDVTLTGDVPVGATVQKLQENGAGYTFRIVLPSSAAKELTRGYTFQVQAGAGQTQYTAKLYRLSSGLQAFSHALGADITNPNPARADVKVVPPSWLRLKKQSSVPELTESNSCYSLKGAVYGVYSDEKCTQEIGRLTTDQEGNTNSCKVPSVGTYYIKELQASAGYLRDASVYPVKLTAEYTEKNPYILPVREIPCSDPAAVEVKKTDSEGKDAQGGASLEGTLFTVCYYKGWFTEKNLPQKPDRTWVLQTLRQPDGTYRTAVSDQKNYKVSGDGFFTLDGRAVLPLGTITVEETKAAKGYLLGNQYTLRSSGQGSREIRAEGRFLAQIRPGTDGSDRAPGILTFGNQVIREQGITAADDVIRGDLQFKKIDENGKLMAGIPFLITSRTTGEQHVIVSDENGVVSTGSRYRKHSFRTNSMDKYTDGKTFTEEAKLDGTAGIWFGSETALDDRRGALLYDSYEIRELQCRANKGKELILTTADIRDNNGTVWLDPVMNPDIMLKTTALEKTTGSHTAPAGASVTIEDSVSYTRLTPGRTYTLQGKLVRKDDRDHVVASATKTFRPEKSKGTVTVNFTLDTAGLEGTELVVTEKLYWDGLELAEHADFTDQSQTIRVPDIKTVAVDGGTGTHTGIVAEKTTVTDRVAYKGLDPQRKYTLAGTLFDKETGEALKDGTGKPVTAQRVFRPSAPDGEVVLSFSLDSSLLMGKSAVAFETVKDGEITAAVHADIQDEKQTVHYPVIKTEASDHTTGGKLAAVSEKTGIIDRVHYRNLVADTEYTLKGILVDKETGKPLKVSGKTVSAEKTFTPVSPEGTEEMSFTFSAAPLEGKSLVVFEKLYQSGREVVSHENIEDESQTVQLPGVKTTAADGQTDTHTGMVAEKAAVRDHVVCSNLLEGKDYTVKGTLVRKDTGKPLQNEDGTEVTAQTSFRADKKEMEVDLVFSFSSKLLAGKSVVAFETLYLEQTGVNTHADLNDADQTVSYPSVSTKADIRGKKQVEGSGKTTLTDHITCRNLVPGNTYRLTGHLYKKTDGTVLKEKGKEITAEKTFTASAEECVVDMAFTFNSLALGGQSVVVFEDLYQGEVLVASHADLNSADQSVMIMEKKSNPSSGSGTAPRTGDVSAVPLYVLILSAAAVAFLVLCRKRKKTEKR